MHDIQNKEDIKILVDQFYNKVNNDKLLSPVFNDISKVNWDEHLPLMYDFWTNILLGISAYKGNALEKHLKLPAAKEHFDRWLKLFFETLDENFTGKIANEAKASAVRIGDIFMIKMGLKKFSIDVIKKNNS